jgi:hypothetical protein
LLNQVICELLLLELFLYLLPILVKQSGEF